MSARITIKAELVAVQEGDYTSYVFKNLDEPENSWYRYIMATKCPNWQMNGTIKIGDIGYCLYEEANAGDTYVTSDGLTLTYKYSATYFINFIKERDLDNTKEFEF